MRKRVLKDVTIAKKLEIHHMLQFDDWVNALVTTLFEVWGGGACQPFSLPMRAFPSRRIPRQWTP